MPFNSYAQVTLTEMCRHEYFGVCGHGRYLVLPAAAVSAVYSVLSSTKNVSAKGMSDVMSHES